MEANMKDWKKDGDAYTRQIGNVTLAVFPDKTKFGKRVRGSKWRAQASHWCEATSTISRYGPDTYGALYDTAKEAMRAIDANYQAAQPAWQVQARKADGEIIDCFTWRGDEDSGVTRAYRDAADHGVKIVDAWAVPVMM
jgi:hypothetical protein